MMSDSTWHGKRCSRLSCYVSFALHRSRVGPDFWVVLLSHWKSMQGVRCKEGFLTSGTAHFKRSMFVGYLIVYRTYHQCGILIVTFGGARDVGNAVKMSLP